MDNEPQAQKRRRWEWIPFLLAMLLSFFCVFTATAMALMSQPDKLDDASMLPVGTANYGQLDNEKERFGQIDIAIFADATQDSAGLRLTPNGSGEANGNRKTPVFIAFVTPEPSDTPVPSPVVVTMGAPGTAVPTFSAASLTPNASASATATRKPTSTLPATATSTSTRQVTATPTSTLWPSPTNTVTPWPTPTSTNVPAPPPPTSTPRPQIPPSATPQPTATNVPIQPTATNTATNTPTATNTAIAAPATATNTATATATATETLVPATATNTPTATATATETPTPTATPGDSRVLSVALVNADSDTVIPGYETMPDGIVLDLATLPTNNLNIWATLDPQYADHVDVTLSGDASQSHTEYYYPYTFPGNNNFDFHGYNFIPGSYTLTFQPYVDLTTPGTLFVFNFTVIDSSTRLPISSVLECVRDNGGGNFDAIFGYDNPNAFEVNIPVGSENRFNPAPDDRGQPAYFHPGRTYGVITVSFTSGDTITWILDGGTATGGELGPACP